jgi:uncharacterized protein (DUF1697 family)
MKRYVALLRGINVGGHRVKMDRLRSLFEELGHRDVATFIASGNVIFSSPSADVEALRAGIEAHLLEALGYEVATFVRTPGELAAVSAFGKRVDSVSDHGGSVYVIFTREPLEGRVRSALESLESDTDRFEFHGREIYWILRGKMSESPLFGGDVTRALGSVPHTARNLTSLRKLLAKHGPRSG